MRKILVMLLCTVVVASGLVFAAAGETPKLRPSLVFTAKPGNVTFPHLDHARRLKGDCAVCHDALFKMSLTEPLGYKAGMHKVAEKARSSCAKCHAPKSTAFAPANNCKRCHVK